MLRTPGIVVDAAYQSKSLRQETKFRLVRLWQLLMGVCVWNLISSKTLLVWSKVMLMTFTNFDDNIVLRAPVCLAPSLCISRDKVFLYHTSHLWLHGRQRVKVSRPFTNATSLHWLRRKIYHTSRRVGRRPVRFQMIANSRRTSRLPRIYYLVTSYSYHALYISSRV